MNNETQSVVVTSREAILAWFTGAARAKADAALNLLAASEAAGGWLPRASTFVHAALRGKANVALKLGKKYRETLEGINHYMVNGEYVKALADLPRPQRGYSVAHMLDFAAPTNEVDFAALRAAAPAELLPVLARAEQFQNDFAGVMALVARLDATRPRPVFTALGASPTVTATLVDLGLAGQAETVRPCPIEWTEVERVMNGKTIVAYVGRLLWPAGTVHGASRHGKSGNFHQCQACGHAIKNAFNWVPLLIDDAAGVPHSLWVGRDCSQTLFGIRVDGEVELFDLTGK